MAFSHSRTARPATCLCAICRASRSILIWFFLTIRCRAMRLLLVSTKQFRNAAERLNARGFLTHPIASADASETKLLIRRGAVEVKVEVNFVMRGTVYPVRL